MRTLFRTGYHVFNPDTGPLPQKRWTLLDSKNGVGNGVQPHIVIANERYNYTQGITLLTPVYWYRK